jgi:hypothetical protein
MSFVCFLTLFYLFPNTTVYRLLCLVLFVLGWGYSSWLCLDFDTKTATLTKTTRQGGGGGIGKGGALRSLRKLFCVSINTQNSLLRPLFPQAEEDKRRRIDVFFRSPVFFMTSLDNLTIIMTFFDAFLLG